ncbi:MAG: secretion protein HlyD, partial [Leptospira sp.]|nr:secretion protein HlyD [Leptospira sp.]
MNSWKFLTAFIIIISILTSCNKKKEIWYCQMHPTYTSDKPGQCPICNMDLVRKEIKSAPDAKISSGSGHSGHEEKKSPDENKNEDQSVLLSPEKQALIGIQTAKTEFRNLTKNISAYSSVAYDPELYTAILEYKEAIKNEEILNADGGTNTLLKSSITRLN